MKRITLFAGHYGSGKTCIAVSYAKYLKSLGLDTVIVDLDIVNPYFRTKDSEKELESYGIELVCSEYANTNLDAPALPKEIYAVLADKSKHIIIDVGGDDRGAVALGRYAGDICESNDFDMFFVANFYRPLTKTPQDAFSVMGEITMAAHIPFTGIINNSNIGDETRAEDVILTFEKAKELEKLSGLKTVMTTAPSPVYEEIKDEAVFRIELQKKYYRIN